MEYLKKAEKTPSTDEGTTRQIVEDMLKEIEGNGEEAVRRYAEKLDGWTDDFILSPEEQSKKFARVPTIQAARYGDGLSVGKFIKTVTYQKLTADTNRRIGAVASRLSRLEGMEGRARAADVRLRKYFPDEEFDYEEFDTKKYFES